MSAIDSDILLAQEVMLALATLPVRSSRAEYERQCREWGILPRSDSSLAADELHRGEPAVWPDTPLSELPRLRIDQGRRQSIEDGIKGWHGAGPDFGR